LYPVGHFGFTPNTFLVTLPLVQVIIIFLATAGAGLAGITVLTSGLAVLVAAGATSTFGGSVCINLTFNVGAEKVNPSALK
jgi:hypothetical protein